MDKGLISKIYKQLIQLNEKINTPIKKISIRYKRTLLQKRYTDGQCSCLENPRDGEAWWAAVYGVAQSRTWLKRLSSSSSSSSRYMKRCSMSLIIRKMQIKTILRYHLTPVKMAIIKKSTNNKWLEGVWSQGKREPSHAPGGNINWCSHYGKQHEGSLKN